MLYVYMQSYDYDRQALPLFRCTLLLLKDLLSIIPLQQIDQQVLRDLERPNVFAESGLIHTIYHEHAAFTLDG